MLKGYAESALHGLIRKTANIFPTMLQFLYLLQDFKQVRDTSKKDDMVWMIFVSCLCFPHTYRKCVCCLSRFLSLHLQGRGPVLLQGPGCDSQGKRVQEDHNRALVLSRQEIPGCSNTKQVGLQRCRHQSPGDFTF